jgi:hypothetical protein
VALFGYPERSAPADDREVSPHLPSRRRSPSCSRRPAGSEPSSRSGRGGRRTRSIVSAAISVSPSTGRRHAPLLGASARADEKRTSWRRTIEDKDERAGGDLERPIRLVERRALAETLSRAPGYAAAAIGALSMFRDAIDQRVLIDAAAFATERSF